VVRIGYGIGMIKVPIQDGDHDQTLLSLSTMLLPSIFHTTPPP
jgi:hypothetical protein